MNETLTLRRLRGFLRGLAATLFVGTIAELVLAGHTDGLIQLVPFALCVLGLLALGAAWVRPGPRSERALRLVMAVVALGSVVGMAEHFWGNRAFARETHPTADARSLLRPALTGAAPLLAPGTLAVTAAVATAATFAAGDRAAAEQARGDGVHVPSRPAPASVRQRR